VSGYRFCRTDDIGLLVDALNRCGHDPPMTAPAFKRSIRDLQVWCSSCMVAFAGADPIGVLIGAKRASETLIQWIAVHPDHRRQGHGRHLLESLGSKLAILGPPRMVAEVPEGLDPANGLFTACGYVEEARLTDYVLEGGAWESGQAPGRFVIPVTVDDLAANGLFDVSAAPAPTCWERSAETLMARKDDLTGFAVATDEGIEAYLLYSPSDRGAEVAALRSLIDDGGERLGQLIARVRAIGVERMWLPRVHPSEIPAEWLERLGFRPAGACRLLARVVRSA
jgi:GNAT superfamily N-acetyltransferase